MSPYKQTLFVVWINQILFFSSLILMWDNLLVPIGILALYVFGCFSEISIHRYYTHKSYETTPLKEKFLRIFALLAGQGATISWVTVHRTHHAFEDTAKDPHSPLFHPWWKILLGLFPTQYKNNLVVDLMRKRSWNYFVFENKHYWLMWTAIWIVSLLISKWLFYFIVAGAALWYIATSAVNILSHGFILGKTRFKETVATNSSILNFFTGIGNHNNHHKFPGSYTYSVDNEIDINGWVIEKFFKI